MFGFNYGDERKGKPLRPIEWFMLGSVAGVVFSVAVCFAAFIFLK